MAVCAGSESHKLRLHCERTSLTFFPFKYFPYELIFKSFLFLWSCRFIPLILAAVGFISLCGGLQYSSINRTSGAGHMCHFIQHLSMLSFCLCARMCIHSCVTERVKMGACAPMSVSAPYGS